MPFSTRNVEPKKTSKKPKQSSHFIKSTAPAFAPFFSSLFFYAKKTGAVIKTNAVSFFSSLSKKNYIFFGVAVSMLLFGYGGYAYIKENSDTLIEGGVNIVANTFADDLQKNEENQTNILLMGSGGEEHEGGFLTDTLIITTINHDTGSISMLSIPRDLHVRYAVEGNARRGKINRVFMEAMAYWENRESEKSVQIENASDAIKTEMEEILGDDIHYIAYIDFQGFVALIDQLGGIEIDVEKRIYDDQYPGPNHTYRTFVLPAGEQILSGDIALKYVRSRHGNAGGDFGRAYRQKKAIIAIKDKAQSIGIFSVPAQIRGLLDILDNHFWTSLSWQEMLSIVKIAGDIDRSDITIGGVQDLTNTEKEWFLYTPPRDLFGGQAVLLPCRINSSTPWSDIQLYHRLLTNAPELFAGDLLSIYNTTTTAGMASEMEIIANRYGITLSEIGNTQTVYPQSYIEYTEEGRNKEVAMELEQWLGIPTRPKQAIATVEPVVLGDALENEEESISPSGVSIYIGQDYVETYRDSVLWYRKCL